MKRRASITLVVAALSGTIAAAALAQDASTNSASTNTNDGGFNRTALEMIVRKNIFDPTRVGLRDNRPRPRAESFTFCGGAFDGPNAVAFFSGAGASNKPLRPGDSINGYKVADVTFTSVKLQGISGPPHTLTMGMSMRHEGNGPWKPSEQSVEADASENKSEDSTAAATPGAPHTASSANDSDIIKRLKARRDDD